MASRRDAALEYIKRRFSERGRGPSVGELAEALGTNKPRALDILRRLAAEGAIIRPPAEPGKRREILLPDLADQVSLGDALRVIQRASDVMGPDEVRRLLGRLVLPVTETDLPLPAALDYLPDVEDGGLDYGHDGTA